MRRVRLDLEREHARILRQDPDKLFDRKAIRAAARQGDIAVDNTDPVFLTLASKAQRAPDEGQTAPFSAVCRWIREGQRNQSRCGRLERDFLRGRDARPQAAPRVDENRTQASRPRWHFVGMRAVFRLDELINGEPAEETAQNPQEELK